MKTTAILLFSLAVIFTLALFYNIKADKAYNIDSPRDQMFSALIEDETYRNEFMEAMQAKYPDLILESAFAITNDNKGMQAEMMNQMVAMCYSDSSMSEMMMGMSMNMCEMDKKLCNKMSHMMINHPGTMKCMIHMMHEKGMINKGCRDEMMTSIESIVQDASESEDSSSRP